MIPDPEITRLEATAQKRGNSELGRALRRVLNERALLLDVYSAARVVAQGGQAKRLVAALHAVDDYR